MRNKYNISTSYFKAAAENPNGLSICPRTPPWYAMGRADDIMCEKSLYDLYFKKYSISQEEFYAAYVEQTLCKLDPMKVLEKYRNKVLVGYYKPGSFDCRTMFVRWIKDETGIVIPELTKEDDALSDILSFI